MTLGSTVLAFTLLFSSLLLSSSVASFSDYRPLESNGGSVYRRGEEREQPRRRTRKIMIDGRLVEIDDDEPEPTVVGRPLMPQSTRENEPFRSSYAPPRRGSMRGEDDDSNVHSMGSSVKRDHAYSGVGGGAVASGLLVSSSTR